ncbi:MAG: S41 family peptidase, partial [Candidatus Zixiibacteriota bacterium]
MPLDEIGNQIDNFSKDYSRSTVLWSVILFCVMILVITGLSFYVLSDSDLYYSMQLAASLDLVNYLYPEQYNAAEMVRQARRAIFNRLDRYSGYLEPEDLNRVTEEFSGSYGGIGITVVTHEQGLMIMSVREDGPAGKVGLRTGDIIIKADTVELGGLNSYQSTYILRGEEGTPVNVTVVRNQIADTLEFSLIREKLRLIHIPYASLTENKSLYIRIMDFEANLAEDLLACLDSLYLNKKDSVKAIILDLRGNPGGLLNEAVVAANLFLDKGHLIVGVKGRSRWRNDQFHSSGRDITNGLPLAILVDRGSASASEILAGSLKYAGRAVLIGDTTFGKGLVQEYNGLYDGSGIRLTTARYYFEG